MKFLLCILLITAVAASPKASIFISLETTTIKTAPINKTVEIVSRFADEDYIELGFIERATDRLAIWLDSILNRTMDEAEECS